MGPEEDDDLDLLHAWLCGLLVPVAILSVIASVRAQFRRRMAQGAVLGLLATFWWLVFMFTSPGPKGGSAADTQLVAAVLVLIAFVAGPIAVARVLRGARWPGASVGHEATWRYTYWVGIGASLLALVPVVCLLWLEGANVLNVLWPAGKVENFAWSETSALQGIELGRRSLLLFGKWCVGNWDVDLLGFELSVSPRFGCLVNLTIPYWVLLAGTLGGGALSWRRARSLRHNAA